MTRGQADTESVAGTKRYKPYPAYRDSGVEWLGEIPAHWKASRTKYVARLESGHTPSRGNPAYWEDCTIPWFTLADVWQIRDGGREYISETREKVSELGLSHSAARLLPKGTVILSRTASVGFSAIMDVAMATTQDFVNWVCHSELKPEYLLFVFRSMDRELNRLTMGSTHRTIYMPDVSTFSTPVPPVSEQVKIVQFVFRETNTIDALITKKERLIELLQEKRTALIGRAVTTGLDSDVPMKDSNVEWLGEIPTHWNVKQVQNMAYSLQTGPFGSQLHADDYITDGIPVINPVNLLDGKLVPNWNCTVDELNATRLERHKLLSGDILFARRGEVGRCGLVDDKQEGWLCGTGCLRMRPCSRSVYSAFLNHLFSTAGIRGWLELESVGSTMQNLNTAIIGRMPIAIPRLEEQRNIAGRLDRETAKIDALVVKVREAIERLKELRTALVSAAVTGKIDVREAAA